MTDQTYYMGIDIGSTTVKVAILSDDRRPVFTEYRRHNADIQPTLRALLTSALEKTGDAAVCPAITGSGGLTLSKALGVPFVQEVIAVATSLHTFKSKI